MTIYDRMDRELLAEVRQMPANMVPSRDLVKVRSAREWVVEAGRMQAGTPVHIENRIVPGATDHPELEVRLYRPTEAKSPLGALLWIHGGGYIAGSADMRDQQQADMALAGECLVVSVEYRLAPEYPYPAAIDDCYAALKWLSANAAELDIDSDRIAIGGASAGGGLAAGLALLARDRGEVKIIFQLLIAPMIDDRNVTPSSHAITIPELWNRELNLWAWQCYLGCEPGAADVSPYAAASRATDLARLPPAFISVGELDLFVDENIGYAQRLHRAGVSAELHVAAGAFHGSESFMTHTKVAQRTLKAINDSLRRALAKGN
jgi:acetyl esterase/lipase